MDLETMNWYGNLPAKYNLTKLEKKKRYTADDYELIVEMVEQVSLDACVFFNIAHIQRLFSNQRSRDVVAARKWVYMTLYKHGLTLKQIGELCGGRSSSSISNAIHR